MLKILGEVYALECDVYASLGNVGDLVFQSPPILTFSIESTTLKGCERCSRRVSRAFLHAAHSVMFGAFQRELRSKLLLAATEQ